MTFIINIYIKKEFILLFIIIYNSWFYSFISFSTASISFEVVIDEKDSNCF